MKAQFKNLTYVCHSLFAASVHFLENCRPSVHCPSATARAIVSYTRTNTIAPMLRTNIRSS